MRAFLFLTVAAAAVPTIAAAHVGHLTGLAGHDHLIAGAAIGTAIAIGVLAAIKSRGKQGAQEAADAEADGAEVDTQEAQA